MKTTTFKWFAGAAVTALLLGTMSSGAMAFDDLEGVEHADKIRDMRDRGIVSGVSKDKFVPHQKLTAQQAIPLIVKSMQLSLAHMTFIKAPEATDYFTNVPNDAWYAEAFIVAHLNGVPLEKDINPNAPVTREQFVHWLMSALHTTGEYAWIEMYHMIEDEKQVSEGYMDSIQKAIIAGVVELPEDAKFRPQEPITRAEAAVMARGAIQFVEDHRNVQELPPYEDPIQSGEVKPSTVRVNDDITKIVLDMGERPHPGWNVKIEGIDFLDDDSAVVRYTVTYPDPAALYPMVIAHPKAEAYVAASYTDLQYECVGVYDRIPDPDAEVSDGGGINGSEGAADGTEPSEEK